MYSSILKFSALFVVGYISFILGSCCSDTKNCPAGSNALGRMPYSLNERVVFKDSSGRSISIQMAGSFEYSPAYEIEGRCSTPRKDGVCHSTVSLFSASVIDSSNLLSANQKSFVVSIDRTDDINQQVYTYSLSAFGWGIIYGKVQNGEILIDQGNRILQYKTPFKTYPEVFEFIHSGPLNISKTVSSSTGRVISFTLSSDTSQVFYVVE
jgi:hypothetical protein